MRPELPLSASACAALRGYLDHSAPVVLLYLDAQQRILTANAYAHRILGADLPGRRFSDLVVDFTPMPDPSAADGTDPGGHLLTLQTPSGLPESYRFRYLAQPDGWLAVGSIDLEEQLRLRTEVLALNHELNDLTRRLHLANAELRELNRLKDRFLGMAAHDLRRPVGMIMTYSEFVIDEAGPELSDEHRRFLHICRVAASEMKGLIDNFLDVSIIESGALQLDLAPTSVADILAGTEPLARLLTHRKDIQLILDIEAAERRLRVDASKVQQVLLNLLGNAVEHSFPGQRVWLSARWERRALVLAVRDEGPGIAAEDQARLFTAFARAGTRKTAGERSTGLGLSIARLVVEAHGGRIAVDSTPGQGATFRVVLPVDMPSQTAEPAAS